MHLILLLLLAIPWFSPPLSGYIFFTNGVIVLNFAGFWNTARCLAMNKLINLHEKRLLGLVFLAMSRVQMYSQLFGMVLPLKWVSLIEECLILGIMLMSKIVVRRQL